VLRKGVGTRWGLCCPCAGINEGVMRLQVGRLSVVERDSVAAMVPCDCRHCVRGGMRHIGLLSLHVMLLCRHALMRHMAVAAIRTIST
jgi:hypothetical protein